MAGDPYLVIVTGAPGTGKSSIGRLLAWELDCGFMESSAFFQRIGAARIDSTMRDTMVLDEDKAVSAARLLVSRLSRCMVVATPTPGIWLEAVDEYVAAVALLRCNPLVLEERLSKRGWPRDKIVENVVAEAFGEYAEGLAWFDAVFEVDTTNTSAEEAVARILDLVREWRTGVLIDWLSLDEVASYVTRLLASFNPHEYRLRHAWSLYDSSAGGESR